MKNMGTIIELMLAINNRNVNFFYHKDTKTFDRFPISAIELQNLDLVVPDTLYFGTYFC